MRVLRYIASRNPARQALLLVLTVVGVAAVLTPIHLFRVILDRAVVRGDTRVLGIAGGVLAGTVLVGVVATYLRSIVAERIRHDFVGTFRRSLVAHLLRVGPEFHAQTSVGQVVARIHQDVGRLGQSVPIAFVQPIVSVVTLLAFAVYLVTMSPLIAVAALAPLPVVLFLVPRINRAFTAAAKRLSVENGRYAGRVQETFTGIFDIQAHATFDFESARLARQEARVRDAQLDEARAGAWLAAVTELTRGVGPILVYTWGAFLAMRGRMSIGTVVAFSGALGMMYLAFARLVRVPSAIRVAESAFEELSAYLEVPQAFTASAGVEAAAPPAIEASLEGVRFGWDPQHPVVEDVSISVGAGEHVAMVGRTGSGKSTVLGLLAGRLVPEKGEVQLGGLAVREMTVAARARSVGFCGQQPFLFSTTLRENLIYALLRRPRGDPDRVETFLDTTMSKSVLDARLVAMCHQVGLAEDLLDLGLMARVPAGRAGDLLALRHSLAPQLEADPAIERFDPREYLTRAPVVENLVFAPLVGEPSVMSWLDAARRAGIEELILAIGRDDAARDLEFHLRARDVNPALLAELGVDTTDLDERRMLVERARTRPLTEAALGTDAYRALMKRGFLARENAPLLRGRIIAARRAFAAGLAVQQYDPARWYDDLPLRENLLFGRADADDVSAARRLNQVCREALERAGWLDDVLSWALDFEVGERGARLSGGQRQKVAIARVLLKEPSLLLLDDATANLDERSAKQVNELIAQTWRGRTVVCVTHRLNSLDRFHRVVVLDRGRVVEEGPPAALIASASGALRALHDAAGG